jgi:cysteine desulfurase
VTYLDHNATSPLLPEARAAWLEAEEKLPGNPSSPHRLGARADNALEQARQRVADLLSCSPPDLVWTSGATEACNTVLHHVASQSDPAASVWLNATEHPAVLECAQHFFPDRLRLIPVDARGVADLAWLKTNLARARPALVGLMAANNETGVLQPWREARELCAASGVPFFCDATQWCGRLPVRGLGACDFVAGSAHKFGGPRGAGFLKCPAGAPLRPLLVGGKQQDRRRAGTENVPGVLAMLAALEWCEHQLAAGGVATRRTARDRFEHALCDAMPGVTVIGAEAERLWNTVSVVMPDAADCRQRWVVKLDKAGFAVSTGSACASGSEQPSHVLTAMGLSAGEAGRALRFSAGWLTPDSAWDNLLAAIQLIQTQMTATATS